MKKTKRDHKPIRRHTSRLRPPPHNVATHNYYSKMVFDGKTLRTESKQDDKPMKRRKYTLKDLEKEIPIGAELVKEYLDYKVPRGLEEPLPKNAVFQSVLPNPCSAIFSAPLVQWKQLSACYRFEIRSLHRRSTSITQTKRVTLTTSLTYHVMHGWMSR